MRLLPALAAAAAAGPWARASFLRSGGAPPPQDGPQARPLNKTSGDVLYLARTWHDNYGREALSLLRTWASSLDPASFMLVGDLDSEDPPIIGAAGCHADHDLGICCRTARSLALAAERIGNRSWVFVVDDDTYVHTGNLERILSDFDASQPLALGMTKCGTGHCDDGLGGFCGGGGYAISKPALQMMIGDSREAFEREYLEIAGSPIGEAFDDVSTTCLLRRRKVPVLDGLQGIYPWIGWDAPPSPNGVGAWSSNLNLPDVYLRAIHATEPLPLTLHYINAAEMSAIHEEFKKQAGVSAAASETAPGRRAWSGDSGALPPVVDAM